MTTPRIQPLSLEEAERAADAAGVARQLAPLSVFRILLRQPAVARALNGTLSALLFAGSRLDPRLRELVILRIAWVTGSVYEWTQHWRVARQLELPEADLLAVRDWRRSSGLSAADRAVLAATDETLASGRISDATWAECCRHLATDEERIELVVAIGHWLLFSTLLQSLEVPLEDGVTPWPPDGRAPDDGGTQGSRS
jgi:alkylhydroperoxidase family enzyme